MRGAYDRHLRSRRPRKDNPLLVPRGVLEESLGGRSIATFVLSIDNPSAAPALSDCAKNVTVALLEPSGSIWRQYPDDDGDEDKDEGEYDEDNDSLTMLKRKTGIRMRLSHELSVVRVPSVLEIDSFLG